MKATYMGMEEDSWENAWGSARKSPGPLDDPVTWNGKDYAGTQIGSLSNDDDDAK